MISIPGIPALQARLRMISLVQQTNILRLVVIRLFITGTVA
jgi:hypothetical protein